MEHHTDGGLSETHDHSYIVAVLHGAVQDDYTRKTLHHFRFPSKNHERIENNVRVDLYVE